MAGGFTHMEHRWSKRIQVRLDAIVFHRLLGLTQAAIRDISLEGVFIGAENLILPSQSIVELTFALNISGRQRISQTEAIVIHRAPNGCGLMFKDFRMETFQEIKGMLFAA
jgi:hypothetical protein